MDWFSWLSKSSLDASLVYEYGLILSHNELEEEDITHFDHEFLQSMGITIAKHRLEIIKLSKKHKKGDTSEGGNKQQVWEKWSTDGTEKQVAKLMEEDIGAAMQFLQSKALCIMPISLATAIYHSQP